MFLVIIDVECLMNIKCTLSLSRSNCLKSNSFVTLDVSVLQHIIAQVVIDLYYARNTIIITRTIEKEVIVKIRNNQKVPLH